MKKRARVLKKLIKYWGKNYFLSYIILVFVFIAVLVTK